MTLEVTPSDTESIAQSLIPYPYDDNRAKYLGLRSSGFRPREALKLIGVTGAGLSFWRKDAQFADLERRLPEFRRQLALEYVNLEFLRNFRLITEKDFQILRRSLQTVEVDVDGHKEKVAMPLTKQEHDYLLKMRPNYTPQQIQALQALVTGEAPSGEFNFTDVVKAIRRAEQIKVRATRETLEVSTVETGNEVPPVQGAIESD